jgi:murein DD-endopeptidase MepM/ murein hydrolase activator NlpD
MPSPNQKQLRRKNIALLILLLGLAVLFFVITIVKLKEQVRSLSYLPQNTLTAPSQSGVSAKAFAGHDRSADMVFSPLPLETPIVRSFRVSTRPSHFPMIGGISWAVQPGAGFDPSGDFSIRAELDRFADICIGPLQEPIKNGQISSDFGPRRHIREQFRSHEGVDYAAAIGTAVMAAAAGNIVRVGRDRGYGRFIEIRHSNGLRTFYAHLGRFDPRVRVGISVNQGEVIGFVGRTGRVTGPNLHFETSRNGAPNDPSRILGDVSDRSDGRQVCNTARAGQSYLDRSSPEPQGGTLS